MPLYKAAGILMASLAIAANDRLIDIPSEPAMRQPTVDTTTVSGELVKKPISLDLAGSAIVSGKPVRKAIPLGLSGDAGQCFQTSGKAPWETMDPKCQKQEPRVQSISKGQIYLEIHKL